MLTKIRNKKQEKGFSLLELAVAVGIAAIVAGVGVTASTVFVNGSQTKADNYEASADSEITNAKASFDGLYGEAGAPDNTPAVAAPGGVVDFYSTNTTYNSAAMVWDSPFTGGAVSQYLIIVGGETVATLAGNVNSYIVTGLAPSSTVAITIRAVNSGGASEVTSNVFTPAPPPAFNATAYTAQNSGNSMGEVFSNYLGMSSNSSLTNYDGAVYTTWSPNTPVIIINEQNQRYGFVSLLAARYSIDYYRNAGNNNPTNIDNVYHGSVGGVPILTPGNRDMFIYYDADPTAGPANKLVINWPNTATDFAGGK